MSMTTRIEDIRAPHARKVDPNDICEDDWDDWPCDTAVLLALVDELAGALSAVAHPPYAECGHLECRDAHIALARLQEQDR